MNKYFWILLLSACTKMHAQTSDSIFLIRPAKHLGSAIKMRVSINGQPKIKIRNGSFKAFALKDTILKIEGKRISVVKKGGFGEKYFFYLSYEYNFWVGRMTIIEITEPEARKQMSFLKRE